MSYKTNYELYSRGSIDSRRSPNPPDELLSPLATLYPHVAALQPQHNPTNCTFTGYRDTGYWAAAYTTQPIDDSSSMRRINDYADSSAETMYDIVEDLGLLHELHELYLSLSSCFLRGLLEHTSD
ncbi:hypothetical protein EN45_063980 [Penicillium chrysogenum]|uniref:Pc19g00370 protein n=2 Tax=Penicillium chrysogenum species complex TaxID=254878 RepID=B6HD28_PENRW|nr:hypothetical protein EN45_063980 [Penicillium chrysogenum]CAP79453.1 Pc19g00370 [Penicillium rubens Wisconsin 54-1255]